jgi:two-component system, NtrC family, response regulator AtoC
MCAGKSTLPCYYLPEYDGTMGERRARRILLVDDSRLTLELERDWLTREGYEVRAASTLADFDAVLRGWAPDVVLTDVKMPEVEGPELCKIIKRRFEVVPVILFSTLPELELAPLAEHCGADGYLSKSQGLGGLSKALHAVCEQVLW